MQLMQHLKKDQPNRSFSKEISYCVVRKIYHKISYLVDNALIYWSNTRGITQLLIALFEPLVVGVKNKKVYNIIGG